MEIFRNVKIGCSPCLGLLLKHELRWTNQILESGKKATWSSYFSFECSLRIVQFFALNLVEKQYNWKEIHVIISYVKFSKWYCQMVFQMHFCSCLKWLGKRKKEKIKSFLFFVGLSFRSTLKEFISFQLYFNKLSFFSTKRHKKIYKNGASETIKWTPPGISVSGRWVCVLFACELLTPRKMN